MPTNECRTPIGGNSTAILAESEIQSLSARTQNLLEEVNSARRILLEYSFPVLSVPLNVDADTQLGDWSRPLQPALDYAELIYNDPSAPTVPFLDTDLPGEITAEPPDFDSALIAAYVQKLLDVLDGSGLPPEFENALWNRARGRVDQDVATRVGQARSRLARLGWSQPTGVEEGVVNQITYEGGVQKAELNRDIMIRVHEVAVQLLLAALGAIRDYLQSWIAAYEAQIRGEVALLDNRYKYNQLVLQRLEAQLRVYEARSAGERARVTSYSDAFRTEGGIFGTLTSESSALSQHAGAQLSTAIEQRRLDLTQQIENSRLRTTERRADIDSAFQREQIEADVLSRTLVAMQQAMDIGVSASASVGDRFSSNCTTTYSYRGDL